MQNMDFQGWSIFPFVTFLLSGKVLSQLSCSFGLSSLGYTFPQGDINLRYGSPLDILCVLHNDSGYNSSLMLFKKNGEDVKKWVKGENSTAIRLLIEKPARTEGDKYSCEVRLSPPTEVCTNTVWIGDPPRQVENLRCTSKNCEKLTCEWKAPKNYMLTIYDFLYYENSTASWERYWDGEKNDRYLDSKSPGRRMSRTWTTFEKEWTYGQFKVSVYMRNALGTAFTNKTISLWEYIIPNGPKNLTVVSRTTSSLMLHWVLPSSKCDFPAGLHHRVTYKESKEEKWLPAKIIRDKLREKDVSFNLTGLPYAYTFYDIRVALISAPALHDDESLWSQSAAKTERTLAKIPDNPPRTIPGGFEVTDEKIRIHWQEIPEKEKNGPEFDYHVIVDEHPEIKPKVENSSAILNLPNVTRNYQIRIWSKNSNGTSKNHSVVVIPRKEERLKQPSCVTAVTDCQTNKYTVFWLPSENPTSVTYYTVFWCRYMHLDIYTEPGWSEINGTQTNFTIIGTNENYNYKFAVSVNSYNSSSGLSWVNVARKPKQIQDISFKSTGSTYIEVEWDLDCYDKTVKSKFIVSYCPVKSPKQIECEETEQKIIFANPETTSGNISNLKPCTTYKVKIAHTSLKCNGAYSPESEPNNHTTNAAPLNLHLDEVTNTSAVLSWEPNSCVFLRNYVIRYNREQNATKENANVTKTKTSYEFTKLEIYEKYCITIEACYNWTIIGSNVAQLNFSTRASHPSEVVDPKIGSNNSDLLIIEWTRPKLPRRIDFYQVNVTTFYDEKNHSEIVNVIQPVNQNSPGARLDTYYVTNCTRSDGRQYAFYMAIRAVNNDSGLLLPGPWSQEKKHATPCRTPESPILIFSIIADSILFLLATSYCCIRCWKLYKAMKRDVEVKLPEGLLQDMTAGRQFWENETSSLEADEKFSKLSSAASASNTLDSGDKQDDSYCVLGVDPGVTSAKSGYVPINDLVLKTAGLVVTGIKPEMNKQD